MVLPVQFKYTTFIKKFIEFANRMEIRCFYYLNSEELGRLEKLFTDLSEAIVKDELSNEERVNQLYNLGTVGLGRKDLIVSDRIHPYNFSFVHHSIIEWLKSLSSKLSKYQQMRH